MGSHSGVFRGGGDFQRDVRALVASTLSPDDIRRGRRRFHIKAAIIVAWALASYVFLVWFSAGWIGMVLGTVSMALALGGIGFSIQHDANHGAVGRRSRILGYSLDLVGVSSYFWRERHNHLHHTFTNVVDADGDIDQLPFARLAPDQRWMWNHQAQHVYMWVLYGMYALKTIVTGDAISMAMGTRHTSSPTPRPRGTRLTGFLIAKVLFITWALVIPFMFRPWWQVLIADFVVLWLLGILLAVVFQLAHCVEEASFTSISRMHESDEPVEWARHQVETTADFAPGNPLVTWYLGGLNFQIEHHLFSNVCHVHYPTLAPGLREVCARHGVTYSVHPTLRSALASHGRWLKAMGQRPASPLGHGGGIPTT